MSCFSGKLKEYPNISVDCFCKDNLDSEAFFLSHCHKDHMNGLETTAFTEMITSSSSKFIYCSDTTPNLLLCDESYVHLKEYLIGLPIDQPHMVTLYDEDTNKKEVVTVTLISAGHCVGSVMFLFEGNNGTVLYTGDFRLAIGDTKRIKHLHTNGRVKDIHSVYIDTTFCLPQMMTIPNRKETKDAVIRIIDKWTSRGGSYMINLLCKGMYGYEYLLKEIAQHYKTKIHVSPERLSLYRYLPDMPQYFTTNADSTVIIHSCKWHKTPDNTVSSLPCGYVLPNGMVPNVIKIKPTSMWFARRSDPIPEDNTVYCKENKTWRVVHSMHASMEEIIDLVSYIKPYHVYANVEPGGLYSTDDAAEWLRPYTRVEECDSCGKATASNSNDTKTMIKEFKSPVKKTRKVFKQETTTSYQVLATYKELGLEEDVSLMPLPAKKPRRDRKSFNRDILDPESKEKAHSNSDETA